MITRKSLIKIAAMSVIVVFTLSGCKKKEEEEPKVDENGQASTDSRQAISENDIAIDDINKTVADYTVMAQRPTTAAQTNTIAGLTIDTTGLHTGTIKLNYDGITVYNNRKRSGSIRLTIINYASGQRWKMAGCVMKVEYLAYRVTRASDAAFIELNGIQNLTNVSGGTWWDLYTFQQPNLSSSVTGTNLLVNFNGGGTASYNIHRQFTYTLSPSYVLTCTGQGIGSSGGLNNLENYGTTRDGDAFTSQVTSPIVWNTTCGGGAPLSGHLTIKVASKNFDLDCLFGVNSAGTPITVGTNQCAYGWKLTWTAGTTTQNKVIAYW
ncbi:MAG: hypothetical protein K0R26_1602 [Bacteroidota bacterium]|jgi:hypothetical protein|nr:hypothetical protein [Bacteroidota bacterium]